MNMGTFIRDSTVALTTYRNVRVLRASLADKARQNELSHSFVVGVLPTVAFLYGFLDAMLEETSSHTLLWAKGLQRIASDNVSFT